MKLMVNGITLLLGMGLLLFGGQHAAARAKRFVVTDATRASPLIFSATVVAVEKDEFLVDSIRQIKGVVATSHRISWNQRNDMEHVRPSINKGDRILVFGQNKGAVVVPYYGVAGIKVLKKIEETDYFSMVQSLVAYSAEGDANKKAVILSHMLDRGPVAQRAALDTIYLDGRQLPTRTLMPRISGFAKNPQHAIAGTAVQLIGQYGGKENVSELIEMMASENRHVAEAAYYAVKNLTNHEIAFDIKGNPSTKSRQIQNWRTWWRDNKDKR